MSKITESARNEDCQIRIPGVCNFNPETTVWCHGNGSAAGKGMWMKANDILGSYGCSSCHDVYDRRAPVPEGMTYMEVKLYFLEGLMRSLLILIKKGLVK